MAQLSQTKRFGKVIFTLHSVVNTARQRDRLKSRLSKTNAVRTVKGKDGSGKVRYGIYTAWKK